MANTVDRITYLSSLVSRQSDIDEKLDVLRVVTSRSAPSNQLRPEDTRALEALESELKDYLIRKEQLRSFTSESLQLQIEQHFQGGDLIQKSRIQLLIIAGVSILAIITVLFTSGSVPDIRDRVQLAGAGAFSVLHMGAAWLFVSALKSFKTRLRQAYTIMSLGVVGLGISFIEQPLITIYHLRGIPLTSLLLPVPFLISAVLLHIGVCRYVKLLGLQSRLLSISPIVMMWTVTTAVAWLFPHGHITEPEWVYATAATLHGWIMAFPIISYFTLGKVSGLVDDLYRSPVIALRQSMVAIALVTTTVYVVRLTFGSNLEGPPAYTIFGLFIVMGTMLVRAGYAFNKIVRY